MLTEDRQAQQVQRRATAVVAGVAALLALVIVAVAVVLLRGGGPGDSSARPPVITGESPGDTTPAEQAEQLTAENVSWSDFYGIPMPVSSAGPANQENGLATGFGHSPAGAVLAAVHISYRVSSAVGPAVFGPTIESRDAR